MKKRLCILAAVIAVIALLAVSTTAFADFGGFSGGSDYGGGGGGGWSDSGSSWGGSSGGFWVFGGDSYDYDDGTRTVSCTTGEILLVLALVAVILIVLSVKRRNAPQTPVQTNVQPTSDAELSPMLEYAADLDEGFSISEMQTKLSNLYVQLQNCWCEKDITPLRPYLTDELYNQSERQLDEIRRANQTPHIENIAVLGVNIRGFMQRDGMDHLIVEMSTRISTYTTDDGSGQIVKGDPNKEKFMTYEWDLCRTSGLKTGDAAPMQTINCPNCGAPVTINKSAKCPYCDSVITLDEHDWVLYSIKGLSQRTQ
ncbi:MAG: TIM44-like domain-containing protein [Clostridia bacterium]|nr:TIM44-like domain-containing protein [Clostridia bacterium]MBR6108611.1 TIM44-like domain-containing protein [Clostridia bacterium]